MLNEMQIHLYCNDIVRNHAYNECPFHYWNQVNNMMTRKKTHGNLILSSQEKRAILKIFQGSESFVTLGKDLRI